MKNLFRRNGFLFVPNTPIGWIIFLAAIGCAVYVFYDIDSRSHSVSDTMINFVFNVVLIFLGYSLIGLLTERIGHK